MTCQTITLSKLCVIVATSKKLVTVAIFELQLVTILNPSTHHTPRITFLTIVLQIRHSKGLNH